METKEKRRGKGYRRGELNDKKESGKRNRLAGRAWTEGERGDHRRNKRQHDGVMRIKEYGTRWEGKQRKETEIESERKKTEE